MSTAESRRGKRGAARISVSVNPDCALFCPSPLSATWLDDPLVFGAQADEASFLLQLTEEGFADPRGNGVALPWQSLYRFLGSTEARDESLALLGLPPLAPWRPILSSRGALTSIDFAILLAGWIAPDGQPLAGNARIEGAVISAGSRTSMLSEAAWATVDALNAFRARPQAERSAESNRRAWAALRRSAVAAGAEMSDFLKKTVVLTPERLKISLRKGVGAASRLVEVIPSFEGAPDRWIEIFDRLDAVRDRYEVPDGDGIVHVLLSPETRAALSEIKRMPGRRIAGDRAEAFLRNPLAALGPEAGAAIDPDQFELAREEAGIFFARFTARVVRDETGFARAVSLLVEESSSQETRVEEIRFSEDKELERFLAKLDERLARGAECCHWEGYDLELLGDTPGQAELIRKALADMRGPRGFKAAEIFDLSRYSERVEGFGAEKPYWPFAARKDDGTAWFPENVVFGLACDPENGGETVALAFTDELLSEFRRTLSETEGLGRDSFCFPGFEKPVAAAWARETLAAIDAARIDISKGAFDSKAAKAGKSPRERKGLVVKPNVATLDYEERRGAIGGLSTEGPCLPASLKSGGVLKDHQLIGLAWLQRLWPLSPSQCRGALLADDMGLGKTVQLLAFMARTLEDDPGVDPILVVAPVSLLDNWRAEIGKFFGQGSLPTLSLYGSALAERRLPRAEIGEDLEGSGVSRLLRRGWIGSAKIVLTTYETLRDLEFSLAMQRWSIMVCDEAQKIKNPNALVSRAAKKQNARFKIACTGTPVENTLMDLWCIFDFIQPGLLGALKSFNERYRKPIEAETDEDKKRVKELRDLIEPQKMRRMKSDVAKDLPNKTEPQECKHLPISERQRALYAEAIEGFRRQSKKSEGMAKQGRLGLLQYLRKLCSDPRPPGQLAPTDEPIDLIEKCSPKMAWLTRQLSEIRDRGEKVIIFCEFRDLQRTIRRVVALRFGFAPDIINGDVSADSERSGGRQRRINDFQLAPGFGAIILSPLAVGFGVNIQAANHVIHFTRAWNPAKEDQATDRAYRIGQDKEVFVYCPVVVADDFLTFDAKLDSLLDWKRSLSADMLNGSGDLSPADFGDLEEPGGASAFGNQELSRDDLAALDPDAFEAFCAALWSKVGYPRVYKTPRVGDQGVDVVALKEGNGVLIQCKSSANESRELGWEAVKDVVAGSSAYAAKHPGVRFALIAATNAKFNRTARAQANINHVELLDIDDLSRLLSEHKMRRSELDRFLFAGWETERVAGQSEYTSAGHTL